MALDEALRARQSPGRERESAAPVEVGAQSPAAIHRAPSIKAAAKAPARAMRPMTRARNRIAAAVSPAPKKPVILATPPLLSTETERRAACTRSARGAIRLVRAE